LDAVLKVNDGFRQDLTRLNQKHDDLKKSVEDSITYGLQDIKEKLSEITVKEILSQIPASFKDDVEKKLTASSQRLLQAYVNELRETPDNLLDMNARRQIAESIGNQIMDKLLYTYRNVGRILPQEVDPYPQTHLLPGPMDAEYWNQRLLDVLADKIALRMKQW
jgi:hypothetical protein